MKPISELYKTSTDYERLVELLLTKGKIVCFYPYGGDKLTLCEYSFDERWGSFEFSINAIPGMRFSTGERFITACKGIKLKFIEPNGE